jgi:hypothetical protein
MRIFNLFGTLVVSILDYSSAVSNSPDAQSGPHSEEISGMENESDVSDLNAMVSILNEESIMVHSVFRILREEVSTMNSLIDNLKERRSRMKKKDHPEILHEVSKTVAEAKASLSEDVREIKDAKKILKKAGVALTQDASQATPMLEKVNRAVVSCIDGNIETIEGIISSLNKQKTGLYSRKQNLGSVIDDIPDRLSSTLSKFESIIKTTSQLAQRITQLSPPIIV